jgi:hypothetical protein
MVSKMTMATSYGSGKKWLLRISLVKNSTLAKVCKAFDFRNDSCVFSYALNEQKTTQDLSQQRAKITTHPSTSSLGSAQNQQ